MRTPSPSTVPPSISVAAISFAFAFAAPLPSVAGHPELNAEILTACKTVSESAHLHQRLVAMQEALIAVSEADSGARSTVSVSAVECVSGWLAYEDDYSKMNAAMVLSRLACKSRGALPALREALLSMPPVSESTETLALGPSASPTDSVISAIDVIQSASDCI